MDASTLTGSTVTLERVSDGAAVSATVAYDAALRTVTIRPASPLAFTTQYRARITTGAKATDGSALAAAVTGRSRPAPRRRRRPSPQTTPANGATDQARGVQPTATFSKDMDASSFTAQSFRLETPDGSAVAATRQLRRRDPHGEARPGRRARLRRPPTRPGWRTAVTAADGAALAAPGDVDVHDGRPAAARHARRRRCR